VQPQRLRAGELRRGRGPRRRPPAAFVALTLQLLLALFARPAAGALCTSFVTTTLDTSSIVHKGEVGGCLLEGPCFPFRHWLPAIPRPCTRPTLSRFHRILCRSPPAMTGVGVAPTAHPPSRPCVLCGPFRSGS
jgi:hypothetical protein